MKHPLHSAQTPDKSNKMPKFLDTKHWHSGGVTDATSLDGGSVSNSPRLSARV